MCISLDVFVTRCYDVTGKFSSSFIGLCWKKTLKSLTQQTICVQNIRKLKRSVMTSSSHLKCGSEKWIFLFEYSGWFLMGSTRCMFTGFDFWCDFIFNIENVVWNKMCKKKRMHLTKSNVSKMAKNGKFFMDFWIEFYVCVSVEKKEELYYVIFFFDNIYKQKQHTRHTGHKETENHFYIDKSNTQST